MRWTRQRLLFGQLAVVAALFVRQLFVAPSPLVAQDTIPAETSVESDLATIPVDESQKLREQLLKLFARKLELMTEAQLAEEVQATERSVAELEAAQKLERLQQSLLELTEMYLGTPSAATAKRMLNAANPAPTPIEFLTDPNDDGFIPRWPNRTPPDSHQPSTVIPQRREGLRSIEPTSPKPAPRTGVPDPLDGDFTSPPPAAAKAEAVRR